MSLEAAIKRLGMRRESVGATTRTATASLRKQGAWLSGWAASGLKRIQVMIAVPSAVLEAGSAQCGQQALPHDISHLP